MEQSYLMELIRTLSHEEKSQAREFAALSFVNDGKMRGQVLPLLDVCFDHSFVESPRTSQKLLSNSQRKIHIEFVNFLTQISNSTPGDLKRSERMIQRIQEKTQTADWRWLFEKAKALRHR